MGLETGTYVEDLVVTNPVTSDQKTQGDDHLRLLKTALKNTFKRATKAIYFPTVVAKSANYSVLATDDNTTFLCDTTTGFTLTLPTLTTDDKGWRIKILKTTSDANAVLLTPPTGTINGYSSVRRSVTGQTTEVTWTGAVFVASRTNGNPIGAIVDYYGTVLPQGHLWANGAASVDAVTMPELFSLIGANAPDLLGRTTVGKENMGGVAAPGRLGQIIDPVTLGAVGGAEVHVLTTPQLPSHSHGGAGNTGNENATHTHTQSVSGNAISVASGVAGSAAEFGSSQTGTESSVHQHVGGSTAATGSDLEHSNLQPSIVVSKLVVME